MTEPVRHCAWCGGAIPEATRVGRPRRYCQRSHRQRAYEARRSGASRGLAANEAVVNATDLSVWQDNRYLLQAAVDDGTIDLEGKPTPVEVRAAYDNLHAAAVELLATPLEPSATGSDGTP